jgi:hypothetical protein
MSELIAGLGMSGCQTTLSVVLIFGVAWGVNMLRRRASLAELFGYVTFWAVGAWLLASPWRPPIF